MRAIEAFTAAADMESVTATARAAVMLAATVAVIMSVDVEVAVVIMENRRHRPTSASPRATSPTAFQAT